MVNVQFRIWHKRIYKNGKGYHCFLQLTKSKTILWPQFPQYWLTQAGILLLRSHGWWKSTTAAGSFIYEFVKYKTITAKKISSSIKPKVNQTNQTLPLMLILSVTLTWPNLLILQLWTIMYCMKYLKWNNSVVCYICEYNSMSLVHTPPCGLQI